MTNIIIAHSQQQYDKCQDYLKGLIKNKDMFTLLTTYWNGINALVGSYRMNNDTDNNIITDFCNNIKAPNSIERV